MSLQKETLQYRLIEIIIAVQTCQIFTIFMFAAILMSEMIYIFTEKAWANSK